MNSYLLAQYQQCMEELEGFVPGIRECNVCLELTNFYNQCTVSDMLCQSKFVTCLKYQLCSNLYSKIYLVI